MRSDGNALRSPAGGAGNVSALMAMTFLQMWVATLVAPAIRPLFAERGEPEWVMHSFMSVNMLGALVAAPLIGRWIDRIRHPGRLLALLAATDAVLLALLPLELPNAWILSLRTLEGAAHVGGATILLGQAAHLSRSRGEGRIMGMAGAAIMFAVAGGNALGAVLVRWGPAAPFFAGACIAITVSAWAFLRPTGAVHREAPKSVSGALRFVRDNPQLLVPLSAAFVGRFSVGCVVVTFALFAHSAHGASDSHIGVLFAALTFSFALSMYPIGRIIDRVLRARVLGTGAVLYATSLFLLGYAPSWGLMPLMILAGVGSAGIFASTLCYGASMAGTAGRGRTMALVNAAGCLGMLLGPMCAAIASGMARASLGAIGGYRVAFFLAAFSIMLWFVLSARWLWASLRSQRRRPEGGGIPSWHSELRA